MRLGYRRGNLLRFQTCRPGSWRARPKTLSLSMAVAVGAALASAVDGRVHWPAITAALAASACIQLGTNLHNDAAESSRRGGDGPDRVGPLRATASGLLDGKAVSRAACGSFGVAALLGLVSDWGSAAGRSSCSAFFQSSQVAGLIRGARCPSPTRRLGELFVIAFFGLGAVCGTYWLCVEALSTAAIAAGLAVGCLTGAVLLVNNHRDAEQDARVGRRTLAIIAGPTVATWVYAGLVT